MTDNVLTLIGRYRTRGVLVDSNILLLYFVGAFDIWPKATTWFSPPTLLSRFNCS